MTSIFSKLKTHIILVLSMLVVCIAYNYPQIQGKVADQGDMVSWKGMANEAIEFKEKSGRNPLWTNSMFGGMPTYQISAGEPGNLLHKVQKVYQGFFDRPVGYFFAMMFGFYIMLLIMGVNPYMSAIGALAFSFTSNHFILFEAGHVSKMRAISTFPLIIGGLHALYKRKWLLGGVVFTVGTSLNIAANHYQMTLYLLITILLWGIFILIETIRNKDFLGLGKMALIAIVGSLLAVGSNYTKLITTYEYAKDTMRGDPILESEDEDLDEVMSSSSSQGLSWTYAMRWSNGVEDLFTAIIPGFVGGSSAEKVGKNSETHKLFKQNRVPTQRRDKRYQLPIYWGSLPFTSGPIYFGAIICFFFVLGLFSIQDRMKWWVLSAVVVTALLSLGENFEWFQRLFFDHFPMYNKFRSPNSILGITSFYVPLLAILGLSNALKKEVQAKEAWNWVKWSAIITGGFCLLMALIGSNFFDMTSQQDEQMQEQIRDLIMSERTSMLRNDAFRSLFFIAAAAGLLWALIHKKLKVNYAIGLIAVLVLVDLWGVGKRYLDDEVFVSKNRLKNSFVMREVDKQIKSVETSRGDYRVLDLSVNTFNSAATSYHHNTIGGYHAAKLQRYQDIIDAHIAGGFNFQVLNMLNTKYIIDDKGQIQGNPQAFGPVWLVNGVKSVSTPNEEIEALDSTDLRNKAVVLLSEFDKSELASKTFDQQGEIKLTNYEPDALTYSFKSSSDQLAVFSEIWYGPNKGWKITVNGESQDMFRANYCLRALELPAGEYTIEFKFDPDAFKTGATISLASSSIVILLILALIFLAYRKETTEAVEAS